MKKKSTNAAAAFFICTLGAAFSGFLAGYFSGIFQNLLLDEWIAALVYAAICLLSGFSLFCILTADTRNRTFYLVRNWAVFLWSIQFIMFLTSPFFVGISAYALLSILAATITALSILCFRLRFLSAIALIPVLGWIIFCCYAVLAAV